MAQVLGVEAKIDTNVYTAFDVSQSDDQRARPSSDVAFCNAVKMRGDISVYWKV